MAPRPEMRSCVLRRVATCASAAPALAPALASPPSPPAASLSASHPARKSLSAPCIHDMSRPCTGIMDIKDAAILRPSRWVRVCSAARDVLQTHNLHCCCCRKMKRPHAQQLPSLLGKQDESPWQTAALPSPSHGTECSAARGNNPLPIDRCATSNHTCNVQAESGARPSPQSHQHPLLPPLPPRPSAASSTPRRR